MTLNFWKKPVEPTVHERVASGQLKLVNEAIDRELRLISDQHMLAATKAQIQYLATCMSNLQNAPAER